MSENKNAGNLKKLFKKVCLIVAAALIIFILVFVIANFQIVVIYIKTSQTLRDLVAIVIDFLFY